MKDQLRKFGYWIIRDNDFFPGCYYSENEEGIISFNGIIASSRMTKFNKIKKLMLFIGVDKQKYIQVNIENIKYFDGTKIGIEGTGEFISVSDKQCFIITATKYKFY